MATVAVLGGGVSGLSAAYYLARATSSPICKKILLLESSGRVGGWIQTQHHGDGTIFELGPRSIRGTGIAGENTVQLVDHLGLRDEVLPVSPKHPAAQNRFIFVDGKLHKLPNGMLAMMRRQSPFSRSLVAQCWTEPFRPCGTLEDESIFDFVTRRLGKEVASYAIDPLCRGIFAGNARTLSMRSCFPPLWRFEKNHGSLIQGAFLTKKPLPDENATDLLVKFKRERWSMWSLKNGLEQLPDRMEEMLRMDQRVEILKQTPCTGVTFKDGKAEVKYGNQTIQVDHVLSSCPSTKLGELLQEEHKAFDKNLQRIPTVSVAVVNLQFEGNQLPVQGFGHLVPSNEESKVMGVLYESCIFPDHDRKSGSNTTRITCMMGGAWFKELFGEEGQISNDEFADIAQEAVQQQMGIKERPFRVNVTLQKHCIPQYLVGHWEIIEALHGYIKDKKLPLSLIGSSYEGVSINDCILNAKKTVNQLLLDWQS